MRLIVDASCLVGEALRPSGRALVAQKALELYIPEHTFRETLHEVPKRVQIIARRANLTVEKRDILHAVATAALQSVDVVPADVYQHQEVEARARLRDPTDWPVLALALVLECGIWTADQDFFGTGVPTWVTANLRRAAADQATRTPRSPN